MEHVMKRHKKAVPTVAFIILFVGIIWLLTDLGIITTKIPWWPLIVILVAIGWLVNYYTK